MNDSLINNRQISQKKNLSPFVNKKRPYLVIFRLFMLTKFVFRPVNCTLSMIYMSNFT